MRAPSLPVRRIGFVPLILVALVVLLAVGWIARATTGSPDPGMTTLSVAPRASTTGTAASDGLAQVRYADLPAAARRTLVRVDDDGPYPYRQDGSVYSNRNGDLPRQTAGYYHEYTVVTPGSKDRGARRIVVGRDRTAYYTADHYETFRRVLR